jgi:hypothetical protein
MKTYNLIEKETISVFGGELYNLILKDENTTLVVGKLGTEQPIIKELCSNNQESYFDRTPLVQKERP